MQLVKAARPDPSPSVSHIVAAKGSPNAPTVGDAAAMPGAVSHSPVIRVAEVAPAPFSSLADGPSSIRGRDRRRVLATCTWKDAASHTSMPSLPSVAIRVPSGLYRKQ